MPPRHVDAYLRSHGFHLTRRDASKVYWLCIVGKRVAGIYVPVSDAVWGSPRTLDDEVAVVIGRQHHLAALPLMTAIDSTVAYRNVKAAVEAIRFLAFRERTTTQVARPRGPRLKPSHSEAR